MELIREITNGPIVMDSSTVKEYLEEFRNEDREFFIVLGLNAKNKVIYREVCSIGTLNCSLVAPREVFKKAIMLSCNAIILAHNHPSGDYTPSDEDVKVTKTIKKCGELLGIKLLDHIIMGEKGEYSFNTNNWIVEGITT